MIYIYIYHSNSLCQFSEDKSSYEIEEVMKLKDLAQANYNNDPDIVAKVAVMLPNFHLTGEHPEEAEV